MSTTTTLFSSTYSVPVPLHTTCSCRRRSSGRFALPGSTFSSSTPFSLVTGTPCMTLSTLLVS